MKNYYIILLASFIISSCSNNIKYNIESIEAEALISSKINSDTSIYLSPLADNLFIAGDYIIVDDQHLQKKGFHIYNKQGEYIKSFGDFGRAKGEIVIVKNSYLRDDNILGVSDIQNKTIMYNINNIVTGVGEMFSEEKHDTKDQLAVAKLINIGDEYLFLNTSNDYYLGVIKDNNLTYKYDDFPKFNTTDEEEISEPMLLYYSGDVDVNPDMSKLVVATGIGAVLDIIDISKQPFERIKTKHLIKPIYEKLPEQITSNNDTMWGFENIHLSDDYIYAVLANCTSNDHGKKGSEILVYNYSGELVKRYKADNFIKSIAVDTDGTLYGIAASNGSFDLYRYSRSIIK